jgi:hypothetical protein
MEIYPTIVSSKRGRPYNPNSYAPEIKTILQSEVRTRSKSDGPLWFTNHNFSILIISLVDLLVTKSTEQAPTSSVRNDVAVTLFYNYDFCHFLSCQRSFLIF